VGYRIILPGGKKLKSSTGYPNLEGQELKEKQALAHKRE
jgi:hypothetical protein